MKEILTNTLQDIYYNVFKNGVPVDADANPTVSILKDGVSVVLPSYSSNKVATGKYSYTLPFLSSESDIQVNWSFSVSGTALTVTEYYESVAPYSQWEYYVGQNGITYGDYSNYLECERVSRHIINSYCGQRFGYKSTTYAVEGQGTETLSLPWRLITLDSIDWTEIYQWNRRPGEVIGWNVNPTWEIASDGWFLRLQPNVTKLDPVYNPEPVFKRNVLFNVKGTWGYEGIPTEVEESSKILTANYLCQDHKYRDKYLSQIRMGDWTLAFHDFAFNGTGDQTVDSLLRDLRNHPGVGLI